MRRKLKNCLMVLAAAALVYLFCVAGMVALTPLEWVGLPFALILWPAVILLPGLTAVSLAWVIIGRFWPAAGISLIVIPAILTLLQPEPGFRIEQASIRPEHYDAIIVTSKETSPVTFYCFVMPFKTETSRFECWQLSTTSFDVYLLHAATTPDLRRITTLSFGTDYTTREYGHHPSNDSESSVVIDGWTDDGKVFLSEHTLGVSEGTRYVVDTASANITKASSLPSRLILHDYPAFSKTCIGWWEEGGKMHRDHMAIAGLQGHLMDLLTDRDGAWEHSLYHFNGEGELVINPAYTKTVAQELYCHGDQAYRKTYRGPHS